MEKNDKKKSSYIAELEDKIVDLSLKLKAKNIELSSFEKDGRILIGKLLHNLKNPVGVIYSFSEMISEYKEEPTREKLEKYIDIINKSASFSLSLLDSFSVYFNLFTSNAPFNFMLINYTEFVSNIATKFKGIAVEKKVKIETAFPKENLMLKLDSDKMTRALSNIIANGLRYTNDKAEIRITIREHQDVIETEISDNGLGISESDLVHILEEFFVVNTYSKDQQKCIGLGLTIANKIIEMHQGEIRVISNLGEGSSFKILLPKTENTSTSS